MGRAVSDVRVEPMPEKLVDVTVKRNGLVIGGIARATGEVARVSADERATLIAAGHVAPLPRLRCLWANRLIGSRIYQPGDELDCESLAQARALHSAGACDWLNAEEFGTKAPARRDDSKMRPGMRRVRALRPFGPVMGIGMVQKGQVIELPEADALRAIEEGAAEPVGWKPPEAPRRTYVAVGDGARVGNRALADGEAISATAAQAEGMFIAGRLRLATEEAANGAGNASPVTGVPPVSGR
jgi:hypothetical protein